MNERMTRLRDEIAEAHYKKSGHVPTEWAVMNFCSGFDAAHDLLMKDVSGLINTLLKIQVNVDEGSYEHNQKRISELCKDAIAAWQEKHGVEK